MQFLGEEDNSIPPREKCTVIANVSSNVNGAKRPWGELSMGQKVYKPKPAPKG